MIGRIKVLLLAVYSFGLLAAPFSLATLSQPAYAVTAQEQVCAGFNAAGASGCKSTGPTIQGAVKLALNILSLVAGVAAVIMIIIAGIRYITSGGDAGSVKGAKEAIIYAIVGIVIVALSQSIINFVLNNKNLK